MPVGKQPAVARFSRYPDGSLIEVSVYVPLGGQTIALTPMENVWMDA